MAHFLQPQGFSQVCIAHFVRPIHHSAVSSHTSHHLYAIYQLGAPADLLKAAYDVDAETQRPAFDSPSEISDANWKDHLGDEKWVWRSTLQPTFGSSFLSHYRAYVSFFTKNIKLKGFDQTLEHYFFSQHANWEGKKEPQMVNRLLSGVLHPFIHTGYACEFGSPGMLAEGLSVGWPLCALHSDGTRTFHGLCDSRNRS